MPMWSSQGKSSTVTITIVRSGEETADRENWLENGFVFFLWKTWCFLSKTKTSLHFRHNQNISSFISLAEFWSVRD